MDRKLSVAIPDSLVSQEATLREKTRKIGIIARASSIFRVEVIQIYHDKRDGSDGDANLIHTILNYLVTPPYLRKRLYLRNPDLSYAGLLPPLRIPSHALSPRVVEGEIREGVAVRYKGQLLVDVGINELVPLEGDVSDNEKVTTRILLTNPIRAKVIDRRTVREYWGYQVRKMSSLSEIISVSNSSLTIITSRKGPAISEMWSEILRKINEVEKITLVFGPPKRGAQEILKDEKVNPEEKLGLILNTLPNQGTVTVRTEEAVLATLAIINLMLHFGSRM